MSERSKRFRVALSFPGEKRDYVEQVAERLAEVLGAERVLYDRYYEAEFARPGLDTYLQDLYYDESDLIAVFLCAEYEKKEWCGLEWRAVRDLIKKRETGSVMPLRFDDTKIPGLFSIDGYVWIADRPAREIADLILQRLEEVPTSSSPAPNRASTGQRIAPTRLTHTTATLFGREEELADLEKAWKDPSINVVTLVAWGGVGKTSLVAKWVADLAKRGFDGADSFDWSFYSQGTREKGGASADPFIKEALDFFGDSELAESAASPWDKGSRLAQLLAERRALLVLDGLEPLQHPPGPLSGELQDPAVTALLKGLAARNAGLCVVTTRVRVEDLSQFRESTALERRLGHLSVPAGAQLLKNIGVDGSAKELEKAVKEVKGHALTLNLLGRFLAEAHGGDIRKRDLVKFEEADSEIQGGHAFRVMGAYEKWLESEGEAGQRALAVLRLLGLFDRPASPGCLQALREEPAIEGLTEPLSGISQAQWNLAISRLEKSGLASRPAPSPAPAGEGWGEGLDAHPLLREYFAKQLQDSSPEAWKQAHSRLFDYLCESTEPQPDTLEGLQPLYQAVAHGCQAGRHQEACDAVYWDRISRGPDAFVVRKLGAFGTDLGAVACFFESPWNQVSSNLSEADQAWLLNQAAFGLRALGRLPEALEPMRATLGINAAEREWNNAAVVASNLSELELTLGQVAAAVQDAEQAVTFADRSEDAFHRMSKRTTLADAQHQAGRREEALAQFREAEAMQAERQPEYELLYSLRGFRYCELLLAEAEADAWGGKRPEEAGAACREVERRGAKMFEWRVPGDPVLDIALDHLTLGRARLYPAILEGSRLEDARTEIEQAVAGLRRAGTMHELPKGLLTRAWLRALEGDEAAARADLAEAEDIATRGPMPLFLADVNLYRARLFKDRKALAEARRLIEKHGYGRRLRELEDAEAASASWPS